MNNFIYSIPTTTCFGKGQIEKLPAAIKEYGGKVLLVYGGGSIKRSGLYDIIISLFQQNEIDWVELGVEDTYFEEMGARLAPCLKSAYVPLTAQQIVSIYKACYCVQHKAAMGFHGRFSLHPSLFHLTSVRCRATVKTVSAGSARQGYAILGIRDAISSVLRQMSLLTSKGAVPETPLCFIHIKTRPLAGRVFSHPFFFHTAGAISIRMGKISSRPSSMSTLSTNLDSTEKPA